MSSDSPGAGVEAAPAAIVPRWEWRTFDVDDSAFSGRASDSVQESDELYLLSRQSDASVKVRSELMDVKRLERVNDDGLEQWMPVMKARFPIAADDVGFVLTTLGVAAPSLARPEYTLDQLVAEVVKPAPELLAVGVHKQRRHYLIDGCMAELTEVRTGAGAVSTIAVESEDPGLVVETVRRLGLGSRRNVNLPRGLKTLHSFGARRYAVIDIGTNSVKFHIGERSADGEWRTIVDRAEVSRLGEGLEQTGRLAPAAIERTADAVAVMSKEAQDREVDAIAAVGTAGLRIAANSAAFVDAVQARSGIEVEVISGEEEARLAYLAAISGLGVREGSLVVFDTGGGSSQFTFGAGATVDERFSVNVGAVRFTEQFGLDGVVPEDVLAAALDAISADLAQLEGRATPDALVAMGGAVTNLAAVKHELSTYDPEVVQGTVLDRAEVDRQIELYRTRTSEDRRTIVGLQPKRAEVILAGACIVRTVLEKLGCDALTVSDRGLRHGLIEERFDAGSPVHESVHATNEGAP
jgi:exopolyphosphatase/guanosine-5'-triphosphate,3'-diphosphate pyrophosphatase